MLGLENAYTNKLFDHLHYESIDLGIGDNTWDFTENTYTAPLDNMPILSNSYDAVLCTQVIEHLKLPKESISEMYRVLKPGGVLYLTAPMCQGEHQQPHDYFRYTSFGIAYLCKDAGFSEVRVTPFGGLLIKWAYELPMLLNLLPNSNITSRNCSIKISGLFFIPIKLCLIFLISIFQRVLFFLSRFDNSKDYPFGWSCIAKKI